MQNSLGGFKHDDLWMWKNRGTDLLPEGIRLGGVIEGDGQKEGHNEKTKLT